MMEWIGPVKKWVERGFERILDGLYELLECPIIFFLSTIWFPITGCIEYPSSLDFDKSLIEGYKLPVIGLKLCWRCTALKSRLWGKVKHHPDYEHLKSAATRGCWLCQAVDRQWAIALQDFEQPPGRNDPWEFLLRKDCRLLLWVAKNTGTASGCLDGLKGLDYYEYVYGLHPRALQKDPSSQSTFNLIHGWLNLCDEQHRCYQGAQKFPTRVIDLSGSSLRLLISNGINEPYVTLSHCWGSAKPLVTSMATLEDKLQEIPVNSLPEMFQDAVFIIRKLGIKYLWIDSLCIIQDSEEDWAREASKMGDIYRYAYLTISVLDAIDCHQRILSPRTKTSNTKTDAQHVESPVPEDRQAIFKQSALCYRAWALQERLLSPRVLFYSNKEIFWECLACTAREGSSKIKAYMPSEYSYLSYECPDVKNCLILPRGESPSLPLSPLSDWHIIVVEYTRCYLTKPTDKLPALSGLAAIFEANTDYTYIAGLWQEDIRDGLLWYVDPSQTGARHSKNENPGPSWSWISSCPPVLYVPVAGAGLGSSPRHSPQRDIKFLDCAIALKDASNHMGEVVYASVTIEADFEVLSFKKEDSGDTVFDNFGTKIDLYLDEAVANPTGTTCLGIFVSIRDVFYISNWGREEVIRFKSTGLSWIYFLVVVPNSTDGGTWRRIGLGRCPESRGLFLSDSERKRFKLV